MRFHLLLTAGFISFFAVPVAQADGGYIRFSAPAKPKADTASQNTEKAVPALPDFAEGDKALSAVWDDYLQLSQANSAPPTKETAVKAKSSADFFKGGNSKVPINTAPKTPPTPVKNTQIKPFISGQKIIERYKQSQEQRSTLRSLSFPKPKANP